MRAAVGAMVDQRLILMFNVAYKFLRKIWLFSVNNEVRIVQSTKFSVRELDFSVKNSALKNLYTALMFNSTNLLFSI
jgi:hypothetical protein